MGVAETAHNHGQPPGPRRVGNIPDFVCAVAEGAQHIELPFIAVRKFITAADTHHRRAAELPRFFLGLARNVSEVLRLPGIGDVENGSPVWFSLASKRVRLFAAMMAYIGDPAFTLLLDDGLIGAPRLQVVVADQIHIALAGFALSCSLTLEKPGAYVAEQQQSCTFAVHTNEVLPPAS